MKTTFLFALALILLASCSESTSQRPKNYVNWKNLEEAINIPDSLFEGSSYLPVYSQIYQLHEQKTYNLTVTVSLRNPSPTDTIFILKADYFDTSGKLIHQYLHKNILIKPMETLEIVIDENDQSGGTGANFLFDWATTRQSLEPIFEAVMISTTGQQGISFLTRGVKISE